MDKLLLDKLSVITEEEQAHLDGRTTIERSYYYRPGAHSGADEIDASVVLEGGKLIDMRPHTRFVHFPRHTHNYVEFVYMYRGSTTHIIDDTRIELKTGDLLFMNQHAAQEILPAGRDDIAVNFMILPEFFDEVLKKTGSGSDLLRDFLISCLTDRDADSHYLYFHVSEILPVQNLMENLIWIMLEKPLNRRTLSTETVALLFLTLMDYTDHVRESGSSYEQNLMLRLLTYIDTRYRDASLQEFAGSERMDLYTLSRLIKRNSGRTFKELLIEKRMDQAAYLLSQTTIAVTDAAALVGYENTSFFHRLFRKRYGMSPREFRCQMSGRG